MTGAMETRCHDGLDDAVSRETTNRVEGNLAVNGSGVLRGIENEHHWDDEIAIHSSYRRT